MVTKGNTGTTTANTTVVNIDEELALFDSLPAIVRAAVRQSPVKLAMKSLTWALQTGRMSPQEAVIQIQTRMRAVCRKDWKETFGDEYPSKD